MQSKLCLKVNSTVNYKRMRYTRTVRILHWLVAAMVLVQIGIGFASDWAQDRDAARSLLDIHVQIGLSILALMVLRILWRIYRTPPPLSLKIPLWQKRVATVTHGFLYVLLFVLPLSGYGLWVWIGAEVRWWGLFTIPTFDLNGQDEFWRSIAGYTHEYAGYVLIGLLALHISAALKHEFVDKDRLIRDRML